jgi:hypothetical protein
VIDLIKKFNMSIKSRILHPEVPFNSQPTLLHTAVQEPHQEEEKALSSFQLNNTVTPKLPNSESEWWFSQDDGTVLPSNAEDQSNFYLKGNLWKKSAFLFFVEQKKRRTGPFFTQMSFKTLSCEEAHLAGCDSITGQLYFIQ